MSRAPGASLLVAALLALPAAAQDPTPFWMPAPPAAKKKPEAPPTQKRAPPRQREQEPPPRKKPARAPVTKPVKTRKAEPPPVVHERATKKRAAPAPSLPEEPALLQRARPAPPVAAPARAQPAPATNRGSLPPIPDVSPSDLAPARSPAAAPAAPVPQPAPVFVPAPAVPPPAPAGVAPIPPGATSLPGEPDAGPTSTVDAASEPLRRWSFSLGGGLWGIPRADGSGRAAQAALAGRFGIALFPWLEVDLVVARASNSDGTAFASATDVHTLFAGRAMLAWSLGPLAVLGGAGGGVVLVQTQYTLQDVGATAITLSSSGVKPVLQPAAALRLRPFRGLEARAEVSAVLRDGRFETMLLGTLGYSF